MKKIKIELVDDLNFREFGKVIKIPNATPTKVGEGWDCWNYVEMMDVDTEIGMGLVHTKQRTFVIKEMERHDSREELLYAINEDIIQPVALSKDMDDPNEKPDPHNIRCFHIKKGEGIILNKGVWHSPAFPANEDTTYLFIIEKKPDKYGDEIINPWVEIENGIKVGFGF